MMNEKSGDKDIDLLKFPDLSREREEEFERFIADITIPMSLRIVLMLVWEALVICTFYLLYITPFGNLRILGYVILAVGIPIGFLFLKYKIPRLIKHGISRRQI